MARREGTGCHAFRRLVFAACLAVLTACGGGGSGGSIAPPPAPAAPPPDPPAVVSAAPGTWSVRIAWSGIPAGATAFNLYWDTDPGVTKATGHRIGNVTSPYVHDGLTAGTTYYYVLTAVDGGGNEGPESAPASATPLRGGADIGQYFDRGIRAPGPANFADNASHPLRGLTTADNALRFAGTVNCLGCHYASGTGRVSDECLMCHFENQPDAPAANHRDGILQMAAIAGNGLPASEFPIATMADYDAWCLQCHAMTTTSLGGRFPSAAARTVVSPAQVAAGRHRVNGVGCIHCHSAHGSGNARIVRPNPANRRAADNAAARFGVFPNDNTGNYGTPADQHAWYRARVDNVAPNIFADADDENAYCNKACHLAGSDPSWSKEKMVRRDGETGLYLLAGVEKVWLVEDAEYTRYSVTPMNHGHVNNEIIPTDDMASWYRTASGRSGLTLYRYPGTADANPAGFDNPASPLPFFPDYDDGVRDFGNGYLDRGAIRYRYTCSTCHDPHGSPYTTSNGIGGNAYPDLRLRRTAPNDLCVACHR